MPNCSASLRIRHAGATYAAARPKPDLRNGPSQSAMSCEGCLPRGHCRRFRNVELKEYYHRDNLVRARLVSITTAEPKQLTTILHTKQDQM